MSYSALWMDVESRKVFRLTVSSNVIYRATREDINTECHPSDMIGRIIVPVSRDLIRSMFVVYKNSKGQAIMAPVKQHHIDAMNDDRSVLHSGIDDIRTLYEVLEL